MPGKDAMREQRGQQDLQAGFGHRLQRGLGRIGQRQALRAGLQDGAAKAITLNTVGRADIVFLLEAG